MERGDNLLVGDMGTVGDLIGGTGIFGLELLRPMLDKLGIAIFAKLDARDFSEGRRSRSGTGNRRFWDRDFAGLTVDSFDGESPGVPAL